MPGKPALSSSAHKLTKNGQTTSAWSPKAAEKRMSRAWSRSTRGSRSFPSRGPDKRVWPEWHLSPPRPCYKSAARPANFYPQPLSAASFRPPRFHSASRRPALTLHYSLIGAHGNLSLCFTFPDTVGSAPFKGTFPLPSPRNGSASVLYIIFPPHLSINANAALASECIAPDSLDTR